jgi:hypothetical protein
MAAMDDDLRRNLDASDNNSKLNVDHSRNPFDVYCPDYRRGMNLQYDLPSRTDAEGSFQLVKTWLESCCFLHPRCARGVGESKLPTRVIDVGSSAAAPRLLESDGNCGKYVALSHRWPPTLDCKTTA